MRREGVLPAIHGHLQPEPQGGPEQREHKHNTLVESAIISEVSAQSRCRAHSTLGVEGGQTGKGIQIGRYMKQHHSCPVVAEKRENLASPSLKQTTHNPSLNKDQHLTYLAVHYLDLTTPSLLIWTKTEDDVSRNSRKIGPKPIPATPRPHPVTQAAGRVQDRSTSSQPTSLLLLDSRPSSTHSFDPLALSLLAHSSLLRSAQVQSFFSAYLPTSTASTTSATL